MNEQITAYVLNELPEDERRAFEAQLQTDPTLRAQVQEMQNFCTLVDTHITKADAPTATFTPEQRDHLVESFTAPEANAEAEEKIIRSKPNFWRHPILLSSTALAACLAILLIRYGSFDSAFTTSANHVSSEKVQMRGASATPDQDTQQPSIFDSKKSFPVPKKEIHASQSNSIAIVPAPEPQPLAVLEKELDAAKQRMDALKDNLNQEFAKQKATLVTTMPADGKDDDSRRRTMSIDPSQPPTDHSSSRYGDTINPPPPAAAPINVPTLYANEASSLGGSTTISSTTLPSTTKPPGPATAIQSPPFNGNDEAAMASYRAITPNTENYQPIAENPFQPTTQHPLSTFSVHTDGASYANIRRFLNDGQRPPANAIRIEELINYFPYAYEPPAGEHPFAVSTDIAEAPWQPLHRLARIAIKGYEVQNDRKAANLVFLIDVSGSMNNPRKLPLVKQSLQLLTEQLRDTDRVAIVTYSGSSQVALESTPATNNDKPKIIDAVNALGAGGSTNGAGGIRAAYDQARTHFVKDGINRVILCSDGDFNVGISSPGELQTLITDQAKSKIFLSVLGFGTGNLNDRTMETLATKGNGNHAYIDSLSEARKVLVDQIDGTLMTIAKDVKIQVEFNPAQVASYRLIGYENRTLAKEDFNNDKKDAGEIGAGHTVTALYEIVPANLQHPNGQPLVDNLKYTTTPKPAEPAAAATAAAPASPETMTVKLRYKQPEGDVSKLIEIPVIDKNTNLKNSPPDFQFATAVAGFGLLLRNSQYAPEITWDQVRVLAIQGKGPDPLGYRGEFLQLIDKARSLSSPQ
ncbi:DUF3520 domain-containing protein [Phragmitibacter flavus]|uniref:DUF3520 domain-containing protein n=1 Tax=Phragmitibacter flavus TaxID=2576071 RepID=A0A5R8KCG6_9BACT|nr:VWA domain-containing protein [Phragmitibacter flavus]TLD69625.1 DUF3520 domain-containing protein [Phragmitibacter flavus]